MFLFSPQYLLFRQTSYALLNIIIYPYFLIVNIISNYIHINEQIIHTLDELDIDHFKLFFKMICLIKEMIFFSEI